MDYGRALVQDKSGSTLAEVRKGGEVLDHADRRVMGPPLLNVTLTPGDVLYIPRAFYHHTATDPAMLDAPDEIHDPAVGGMLSAARARPAGDVDTSLLVDQPSMALTISILCEDVFSTWMFLLGEALQEAAKRNGLEPL